jgi:hypothetical protein
MKWSSRFWGSTDEKSIYELTDVQRESKVLQERIKCWVDSIMPQPATQDWTSGGMMPWIAKFDLVGNLSLNNLQAKIDTFKGTCLCHKRSSAAPLLWNWEIFCMIYANECYRVERDKKYSFASLLHNYEILSLILIPETYRNPINIK